MDQQVTDVEGTLQVTDDGEVPAPDWYADYEGPVEIVTPALTVSIESRSVEDGIPRKLAGETAPFPMDPSPWHSYGDVDGMGLDEETERRTAWTQPDKILFDLDGDLRGYRIEGLTSMAARNDC